MPPLTQVVQRGLNCSLRYFVYIPLTADCYSFNSASVFLVQRRWKHLSTALIVLSLFLSLFYGLLEAYFGLLIFTCKMSDSECRDSSAVRRYTSCNVRISGKLTFDFHTLCIKCRGSSCTDTSECAECTGWSSKEREQYARLILRNKQKCEAKAKSRSKSSGKAVKNRSNTPSSDNGSLHWTVVDNLDGDGNLSLDNVI